MLKGKLQSKGIRRFRMGRRFFVLRTDLLNERCKIIDRLYENATPVEVLRNLSTLTERRLEKLTGEQARILADQVDTDPKIFTEEPFRIGEQPFWKVQEAMRILKEASATVYALPRLYALFYDKVLGDEAHTADRVKLIERVRFRKIVSPAGNILAGLYQFLSRFEQLQDGSELTEDEIHAGIESLAKFGDFAVIYSLAKGDPLKFDEIAKTPAETIYFTLLYERVLSVYRQNLQDIKDRRENVHNNSGQG